MKQYCLKITSKNEKSLKSFLELFSKYSKTQFNVLSRSTAKKKSKKFFSLLKSPHVNKTAQEQFEFRTFSVQVHITTSDPAKNLMFLKKLTKELFHDISVNLKLNQNSHLIKKNKLAVFSPDNLKFFNKQPSFFNCKRKAQTRILKKLELSLLAKFLKTFDVFGEIVVNNY